MMKSNFRSQINKCVSVCKRLDEIVKSSGQPEADVVLDLLAGMEELNLIQEIQ